MMLAVYVDTISVRRERKSPVRTVCLVWNDILYCHCASVHHFLFAEIACNL